MKTHDIATAWEWDAECKCWWLADCPDHCIAVEVGEDERGGFYWHVDFHNGDSQAGRAESKDAAMVEAVDAVAHPVPPGVGPYLE